MERELWMTLYKLARACGSSPWWENTDFFRLGDRGCLSLGSHSRSSNGLGVPVRKLA